METIVSLKDVVKEYSTGEKTFRALDHVSLDIGKGKFVCILGPSGAGKSTLLNLIGCSCRSALTGRRILAARNGRPSLCSPLPSSVSGNSK